MDESAKTHLLELAESYRVGGAIIGALAGFAIIALLAHLKVTYPGHRKGFWPCYLAGYIGYSIAEALSHTAIGVLPNTCAATVELMGREGALAWPCQRDRSSGWLSR
ncbi:hypothetical protein M409DRAFT_24699 [Zasmidium cellare ATCC 36951]|uniref:Uncharacterized protein n=1 Tax=Zasmidium cellare ATCC 36951 TaxID=1080233 RepID=A0A6A6CC85_ZASCE|nr:uncharacterized protein M409DRAFT_24699 [Zasmidium cellare ATCC 36951]KAF2164794.1 hypothetical protein M409DRAFT_24699 [Zasmidium cellare ATCC 36951]